MPLMPVDLVRGDVPLPSLPDIFQRFTRKLEEPGAKASDFSAILETDPSLTMRVLQIVNSAYYSFRAEITSVAHAVTIVGLTDLRELILAVSVVEFFNGLPNDLISMKQFWSHSVQTGLLARELQKSPGLKIDESMFTAGMLHDVGSLVLYNRLPEMSRSVIELRDREHQPVYKLENRIIGFNHAMLGAELMRHWRLPEFLQETVGCHHEPDVARQFPREAQLLALANAISNRQQQDPKLSAALLAAEFANNHLSISGELIEAAIIQAQEQLESVMSSIVGRNS